MHSIIESKWDQATGIVRTRLTGPIAVEDVAAWNAGLLNVIASIPAASRFRLLVNLVHYDPVDIAAHKAMRSVIPLLLGKHGMRTALLDLFDDDHGLVVTSDRGVRCTACVNVHHDVSKMAHYQEQIGTPTQAFLSNLEAAEVWLSSVRLRE